MTTTPAMPELPEPAHRGPTGTGTYFDSFTADQMRAYALATLQAQPAEVSDATINRLVYEHTKLNPNQAADLDLLLGFRKAVRAILALRPRAVPMTDERLAEVLTTAYGSPEWTMDDVRAARAVEAAALGITAPAGGEKQA